MKTCRVCKAKFTPRLQMQIACSLECALSLAVSKRGKEEKRALVLENRSDKEKREKLKSKAQWAREAQTAFNAYIRLRDDADPCISCGRYHAGQYHAGHYLSVGARPELRFEPLNVHKLAAMPYDLAGYVLQHRPHAGVLLAASGFSLDAQAQAVACHREWLHLLRVKVIPGGSGLLGVV